MSRDSQRRAQYLRLARMTEIASRARRRRVRTRACRYASSIAESLGLLKRPRVCEWCRLRLSLERHHWDYARPLLVTYLCRPCHEVADTIT